MTVAAANASITEVYLRSRGWLYVESRRPALCAGWLDPQYVGDFVRFSHDLFTPMPAESALVVQRARDAAEERDLFRLVLAARMSATSAATAAKDADDAVAEYRARYAPRQ